MATDLPLVRLRDFEPKTTPTAEDIVYGGDMADDGKEKQFPIGDILNSSTLVLHPADNLSDVEDAEESRANLGLEIGADVQAYSSILFALSFMTTEEAAVVVALGSFAIETGANKHIGLSTLSSGTVTVNNTLVTADSIIFLTPQNTGANPGNLEISARVASTSFTISSSDPLDDRDVGWLIYEPIP